MSLEDTMRELQQRDEERGMRFQMLNTRKLLAGALCGVCGEPLGTDVDIEQSDDGVTMHSTCVPTPASGGE